MRKVLIALLFLFFLVIPKFVFGQENWVIDNFQSEIKIIENGNVEIKETIDVDFGPLPKHGIYRDIPYVYDSSNGKVYTKIQNTHVLQDGSPAVVKIYNSGNNIRIQIGSSNKTISGKHTYEIDYTAVGILRSFVDHDELFWNVTGNNWGVSINKVAANVYLPKEGIIKIACYEGFLRSSGHCQSDSFSSKQAVFESSNLSANQGLTIVVSYRKGLVPIITIESPKNPTEVLFTLPFLLVSVLSFLISVGFVFFLWWKAGRDFTWRKKHLFDENPATDVTRIGETDTIVVEYEPPENLRPAEIGVLLDEKADTLDVTATIIDLAGRGFLEITEEPKKWVFGSIDYTLSKTGKDESGLLDYEKELIDRLFEDGDIVSMSSLKTKFYEDLKKVKDKLYDDVTSKNYFPQNPEKVRTKYVIIGVAIIFASIFAGVFVIFPVLASNIMESPVVTILIALIVLIVGGLFWSGIFILIVSNFMPRRTALGREMLRRAKGYELFITRAQTYRQQFFERKNMFNQMLPYAIVFKCTEKFAKAFADMGIKPQNPAWYHGTSTFNAVYFGTSMASFTNSFSSAIASAPKSSGFGGGGFSGGGFGGGGGGSW